MVLGPPSLANLRPNAKGGRHRSCAARACQRTVARAPCFIGAPGTEVDAMRFISEGGYSVKLGQEEAHQQWLEENEAALAASVPEGVKYLGTFVTVLSSEKQSGFYKTYLELDSYAALDRLAIATKDASSDWGQLNREFSRFADYDYAAPWSGGLYKAVVDATIFDLG